MRRDDRRNEREDGSRRGDRSSQRPYVEAPEVPEDIHISQLDKEVRQRLRTLSKDNAEDVGRHLVMAGALIEIDPELAYKHAQVAVARGGRVDVVREAGALTAYATGRYAEALRELRTVRRLSGSNEHLPLMADCERGLGRPERAIDLARSSDAVTLGHRGSVEMEIVAAGARLDLGQADAAYVALKRIETKEAALQTRIDTAMVAVLRAMGRDDQATALEATLEDTSTASDDNEIEYDITVYDVAELPIPADNEVSEDEVSEDEAEEAADDEPTIAAQEPASDSAEEETQ